MTKAFSLSSPRASFPLHNLYTLFLNETSFALGVIPSESKSPKIEILFASINSIISLLSTNSTCVQSIPSFLYYLFI